MRDATLGGIAGAGMAHETQPEEREPGLARRFGAFTFEAPKDHARFVEMMTRNETVEYDGPLMTPDGEVTRQRFHVRIFGVSTRAAGFLVRFDSGKGTE